MSRNNRGANRDFRRRTKQSLNQFSLAVPFTHNLFLTKGVGVATISRATSQNFVDFENLTKVARANQARFKGARGAENLVSQTNQDTGVVAGGTSAPTVNGTNTYLGVGCISAVFPAGVSTYSASNFTTRAFTIPAGITFSAAYDIATNRPLTGSEAISIYIQNADATVDTTLTLNSSHGLSIAYKRFTKNSTEIALRSCKFGVFINSPLSSPLTVYFTKRQVENATGQANQNPSSAISKGVLATPYLGAGIDGAQYFDTDNGNTVSSNVVTEAAGAKISSATLKGIMTNALDIVKVPTAYNLISRSGTLLFQVTPLVDIPNNSTTGSGKQQLLDCGNATGVIIENHTLKLFDGTNTVTLAFVPLTDITYLIAISFGSVGLKLFLNGAMAAGSFDGSMNLGANLTVGGSSTDTTMNFNGTVKELNGSMRQLSDALLITMTTNPANPLNGKKWSINILEMPVATLPTVSEFGFYEVEDGVLLTGGTLSASSNTETASNTSDGSTITYWQAAAGEPQRLIIEYADAKSPVALLMASNNSGKDSAPKHFTIDYLDYNTGTWIIADEINNLSWDAAHTRILSFHNPLLSSQAVQFKGKRWKITTTSTDGDLAFVGIAEVQFRTAAGGSGVYGGAAYDSSNQGSGSVGAKAFDGNDSTYWGSNTLPASVEYEYLSSVNVVQVAITSLTQATGYAPKDFTIQWFNPVTQLWVVAATLTNQTGWGLGEQRLFNITAQF